MTVIEKQCMEAIVSLNHKKKDENKPDWEQRRYEIARDAACAFCGGIAAGRAIQGVLDATYEDMAYVSVRMADALIAELKKGSTNQ